MWGLMLGAFCTGYITWMYQTWLPAYLEMQQHISIGKTGLLGALVPLHVQRAWRSRKNRVTGTAMVTFNAVLVVTSFGLYYAGSEVLRPWMSGVHTGVGLALPVLIVVHIVLGRRYASRPSG